LTRHDLEVKFHLFNADVLSCVAFDFVFRRRSVSVVLEGLFLVVSSHGTVERVTLLLRLRGERSSRTWKLGEEA